MRTFALGVGVLALALCEVSHAQSQAAATQAPPTETLAPSIPGVVAAGAKVEVIKAGFRGSEGPIGLPDGSLIFSETTANRTIKIDRDNNVTTFLENTNGSNGMGFDPKGRLIATQVPFGNAKVAVIYPKGSEAVLADNFEGKPFGRPNDLVVDKKGGVYFTDSANPNPPPPTPLPLPAAVYYVPPAGKIIRVAEGVEFPNGLTLSRDEKILYLNNARGQHLLAYDVQPDGTLRNRRNFASYEGVTKTAEGVTSGADGLIIDTEGRLYTATTAGVQVFSPAGQHLGTIVLSRAPQNLAFAGADRKTLYIVGRGVAFKVPMLAQGLKDRAR